MFDINNLSITNMLILSKYLIFDINHNNDKVGQLWPSG